jgi:hypothetical protein
MMISAAFWPHARPWASGDPPSAVTVTIALTSSPSSGRYSF